MSTSEETKSNKSRAMSEESGKVGEEETAAQTAEVALADTATLEAIRVAETAVGSERDTSDLEAVSDDEPTADTPRALPAAHTEEPAAPADLPSEPFDDEKTREEAWDAMAMSRMVRPMEPHMVFRVEHAVRTHTGLVRDHNEDDYVVDRELGVYLVADGMGGHAAGKVASAICVQTVERFFMDHLGQSEVGSGSGLSEFADDFAASLRYANRQIYEASLKDPSLEGMGTTAVGLRINGDKVAICHAGDSRCYLLRDGRFEQVTVDHSLSNFLLSMGRELEARLAEATMSNVIMRALGLELDVVIDTQEFELRTGDRLMLCSDGLSDLVPLARLDRMVSDLNTDREVIAEDLVKAALDAGGRDNITVLIVDIVERLDGFDESAIDNATTLPSFDDTIERAPGFRRRS